MLDQSRELVDVIDDFDRTIGTIERRQAYAEHKSHRIVHVMVENEGRLLIVRRALGVRYLPGYFCTSAGGHVLAGESFATAAARELFEEIGLQARLELIETFSFYHEFRVSISLFLVRLADVSQLRLNVEEVKDGNFYSFEDIDILDRALFHPQLDLCIEKTKAYLHG